MLVLSRQVNETIIVTVPPSDHPQEITIAVIKAHGNVRLGIGAAPEVTILRDDAIKQDA
jgi:carbon storage regulator CsrA